MEEFFTVPEIAKMLKSPANLIRIYLRDGRMKGFKHGASWRISKEQFEQYMQENTNTK